MKILRVIILAVLSGLLLFASCKKHTVPPVNQLSLLPPATQTGARTIGCLINGQAFVPKNRSIIEGPDMQCNYILLNGGYYFLVGFSNFGNGLSKTIKVETDSLSIVQGQTYNLGTNGPSKADGEYFLLGTSNKDYLTGATLSGALTITKLDPVMQIVSGTFYFKAVNAPGDTVNVTEGRFDMPYTR